MTRGIPTVVSAAPAAKVPAIPHAAGTSPRSSRPSKKDVSISSGKVTTFAGDGTVATTDGYGTAAEFKDMGGAVVVGGVGGKAYVMTAGALRRVDLATTYVDTLAGSIDQYGCMQGTSSATRFSETPGQIDSDGTYLYVADSGCNQVVRVAIATGASSLITTLPGGVIGPIAYGPDGNLYAIWNGASPNVRMIDPATGTTTTFASLGTEPGYGVTADATYVWVSQGSTQVGNGTQIDHFDLSTGANEFVIQAPSGGSMYAQSQLVSSGNYLYSSYSSASEGVERITETDGTVLDIAGTADPGYVNGTGTDAWFSSVTGLASDGTNLFAADSDNHRFRMIVSDAALPSSLSPSASMTMDIYPGKVTTFAGSGAAGTQDGNGPSAVFADMTGAVVVGGLAPAAYVMTAGAVRKVDLSTAAVSTLAGSDTEFGCVQNSDPNAVRFSATPGQIDSDGYYLYVADSECNQVVRVSIATGATSLITTIPGGVIGPITYAPDGYLYAIWNGAGPNVRKIDRVGGTTTTFAALGKAASGITADATYLWVSELMAPSGSILRQLDRFLLTNYQDELIFVAANGGSMTGTYQMVSAGQYIYTSSAGNTGVERITKVNGAVGTLAGGSSGQSEGEWSNAKFSSVIGVAFDGASLWIADSGNHLFSKAVFVPLQAQEMGVGASSDGSAPHAVVGDPVDTNPASGAFMWSATDATLPTAGLLPFAYTRYYSSRSADIGNSALAGSLGIGWRGSFDATLEYQDDSGARVTIPNGQVLTFTWNGSAFIPGAGVFDTLAPTDSNTYTLTRLDGTAYRFEPSIYSGWMWRLQKITDRDLNTQIVSYNGDQSINIVTAGGQTMTFSYGTQTVTLTLSDSTITPRTVVYNLNTSDQLVSVKDLNGFLWAYSYQGSQLSQVSDPDGKTVVKNVYGTDGRIFTQQDGDLPVSTYDYTSCGGNCTKVTDGRGHVSVYQYQTQPSAQAILVSVLDQDLYTTAFSNYADYNPQTVTDPRNNQWQYTYYKGNVSSVVSPGASGNATYAYNGFNEITYSTDARGKVTRHVYDSTGNLQCEILPTAAPGTTTCTADTRHTITYTEYTTGQVHTVTNPANDATSTQGGTTTYTYYADGAVSSITRPGPAGGATSVTTYSDISYDSNCLCQTVTMVTPQGNAINCGAPCSAYTWTYKYDRVGHLTSVIDPLLNTTSYVFDSEGRMASRTDARLKQTVFTYVPGTARVKTEADRYGTGQTATTTYYYDNDGNLLCEVLPTAAPGNTSCTFDTAHTVSYAYTNDNRLASTTDPDQNAWSYDYSAWLSLGKITETLPGPTTIARSYDADNRLTLQDYSDTNTHDVSYDYSSWVSLGKVGMTDNMPGGNTVVYTYDALKNLTSVKRGTAAGFTYGYFPDGSISSRTYPDGTATSYTYFPDGSLTTAASGGKTTSFTYSVANATVTENLPNQVVATSTRDTAGRLTSLTNIKSPSTTISTFTVTPDAVGNPSTVVSTIRDATTQNLKTETQTYTYDDGERVAKVCYLANCVGTNAGFSWTYDAVGNRITQTTYSTSQTTAYYFYDGANHLCWSGLANGSACGTIPGGDIGYAYNARGDQTGAGSVVYAYDQADRLTQVTNGSTIDSYTYDGAGNRLTNTRGTTTTNYTWDVNASVPLLATDSDGGSSSPRDYIYGGGPISEKVGSGGTRYYYSFDAFGSVVNVTTANGGAAWSYWYDPWGVSRAAKPATGAPTNYVQFDGEYHDNTGAYNLRARIYQPGLGAFQQSDPAGVASYAFASGRPTVLSDPSGMLSIWGWIGIGIAVAAVAAVVTCAAITVGICASFTVFGLGATATAAGTGAVACEEGACNEAGQLLNELEQAGDDTVQLFRHVDPTELEDIRNTGEFRLGPNSTGKYFAESAEHAQQWGDIINSGEGAVVETNVPRFAADQLFRWEKLDGIGPARYVGPGQLAWFNHVMDGIREVP